MTRPFDFSPQAQAQARVRQFGICAHCGMSLDDVEEHAHHVYPNQSGDPRKLHHAWLALAANCVVLCHACHEIVHEGGKYRFGAVAPPTYFLHSHGSDDAAHSLWALQLSQRARSLWPAGAKARR